MQSSRRKWLKTVGVGTIGALAGCVGGSGSNSGGGGNNSSSGNGSSGNNSGNSNSSGGGGGDFVISGNVAEGVNEMSGAYPQLPYPWRKELQKKTNGNFVPRIAQASAICSEETCASKTSNGIVQVGLATYANVASTYPQIAFFNLPDLFPTRASMAHVAYKKETWEKFYVPFAKNTGIIPIAHQWPQFHNIHLGNKLDKNLESENITSPDPLSGTKTRKVANPIFDTALNTWDLNPVAVSWGDTIQGIKSGTIGALQAPVPGITTSGMADVVGQSIIVNFSGFGSCDWGNVDWLKSLSESRQKTLANTSKKVYTDILDVARDKLENTMGLSEDPGDDTVYGENDITVTILSEEERRKWMDPISAKKHPEKYNSTNAWNSLSELDLDPQNFLDYLYESAREDDVPEKLADVEPEVWWDDYINQI